MDRVLEALARPEQTLCWPLSRWEVLIGQARRANLLARMAVLLAERDLLQAVHERPRAHLIAANRVAERQRHEVFWEVGCIRRALAEIGLPVILLKGAAYVMGQLPCARGRLMSDIDILVPRERLADVEQALIRHGWMTTHLDAYDQRYYRTWMHELPPMRHVRRGTTLDVHYSITPLTSRYPVEGAKLIAAAQPLPQAEGLWSLGREDLVVHSAMHLVLEGELDNGLRDLVDIDDLVSSFEGQAEFWPTLWARAYALNVIRPVSLALELASDLLGTKIPPAMPGAASAKVARAPMPALFRAAVCPEHPSCYGRKSAFARWVLYIRGHYLRMPLRLLIPHLIRKGWRQETKA